MLDESGASRVSILREMLALPLRLCERVNPLGRNIARRITNAPAMRGISQKGEFAGRRGGFTWILDLSDPLQRALYFRGAYAARRFPFFMDLIAPSDLVADIGANIGTVTLPTARRLDPRLGGHVYAFEPNRSIAEKLEAHIEMNELSRVGTVVVMGLGDRSGTVPLRASTKYGSTVSSTHTFVGSGQPLDVVPVSTLDRWRDDLGIDRIDVIKIDAEGYEVAIIDGMKETLSEGAPRLILVEVIEELLRLNGHSGTDIFERLAGYGYQPRRWCGGRLTRVASNDELDRDVLFAREDSV